MRDLAPALRLRGVRKSFSRGGRRRWALAGLDLEVPRGSCYGLLGVNGSGKTTAIRVLTGLARRDAGTVEVLGRAVPSDLAEVVHDIGVALGDAHLFPAFSAEENLHIVRRLRGVEAAQVGWALELVGLAGDAHRPVRDYSTGMRQRLALAGAVLGRPSLVVLDEPERGLDPLVLRDLGDVLDVLHDGGTTVVMSSHQLAHVRRSCTHVGVLRAGVCVAEGPIDDVLRLGGGGVEVVVDDAPAAQAALRAAGASVALAGSVVSGARARLLVAGLEAPDVARALAAADIYPRELVGADGALEGLLEGTQEGRADVR